MRAEELVFLGHLVVHQREAVTPFVIDDRDGWTLVLQRFRGLTALPGVERDAQRRPGHVGVGLWPLPGTSCQDQTQNKARQQSSYESIHDRISFPLSPPPLPSPHGGRGEGSRTDEGGGYQSLPKRSPSARVPNARQVLR